MIAGGEIQTNNLEALIQRHMAFIIRTASNLTGRYISVENDDEFSVALEAFAEAVERYRQERGNFLAYAGLVIESRLKTYLKQQRRRAGQVSLDALQEEGIDFEERKASDDTACLREEIGAFRGELALFGITLEVLADQAPKHRDTRIVAIDTAEEASGQPVIVRLTYEKRRLPIREVCRVCSVTEKIVKRSKLFILAVMIIFIKELPNMIRWIKGVRCSHVQ